MGIALAERDTGRNRPVIMVVGDGSFQYSVQSIWTAGQLRLPILIVVLRNEEYCILKSFAVLEDAPGVPGLDVRGIDTFLLQRATATVLHGLTISTLLKKAATEAWTKSKPTELEVPISPPGSAPYMRQHTPATCEFCNSLSAVYRCQRTVKRVAYTKSSCRRVRRSM